MSIEQASADTIDLPAPHSCTTPQLGSEGLLAVSAQIKCKLREYLTEHQPDFAQDIGDDMSFDYIGLDSVARVELVSALEKEFGVSIEATAAYDFVTVGALASFVWSVISNTPLDLKKTLGV